MKNYTGSGRQFKPLDQIGKEEAVTGVSLFVTDICNLNCSYCYLPKKNKNRMMSFETAKKTIDYFIENSDIFNADKFSLDFMGGEPLIALDLIDQIVDYFKVTTYKLNHPWFNTYRVSITTNGTMVAGNEKFFRFCAKNRRQLNLSISVDGVKEAHNLGRVYYDGNGGFDDTIKGLNEIKKIVPSIGVKSTFSHDTLKYLKDSVIYLSSLGDLFEPYSNLVYENCWQEGDDLIYEDQLRQLADYLVDNDLYDKMEVSFFGEFDTIGEKYTKNLLKKHWCSCGQQISVSPEGDFYPCSRFHELSLFSDKKERKIGNADSGIDFDKLRPFRLLKLSNCSSSECLECPVATGCGMCSGLSYDDSETNTIFCRTEYICKMHKARIRAKNYLMERLAAKKPEAVVKKHFYISQLTAPRKVINIMLAPNSVNTCGYNAGNDNRPNDAAPAPMPLPLLKNMVELAKKEHHFINLIYPQTPSDCFDREYAAFLNSIAAQRTRPYHNENTKYVLKDASVFVLRAGQEMAPEFSNPNVIVLVSEDTISVLHSYVGELFRRGALRVNLVTDLANMSVNFDLDGYRHQLEKIAETLFGYFQSNQPRFVNVLTDVLFSTTMNNCNAGISHITVGPDGRFALCPELWRQNITVHVENLKIPTPLAETVSLKKSPLCEPCDAFQCRRCIADNISRTAEYGVPGEFQCILSHTEREVGRQLQQRLISELKTEFPHIVPEVDYVDPFREFRVW